MTVGRSDILREVQDLLQAFIRQAGGQELFDHLLSRILELTSSEYGFIGDILFENDVPYLRTAAITDISWNDETRAFYEQFAPQDMIFRNLETLFGLVMKTGEVVIANDAPGDARGTGIPIGHPALRTFLGVPLKQEDRLIGMFGVANRKGGYDLDLVAQMEPLWQSVAVVLQSHQHARATSQARDELTKFFELSVDMLCVANQEGYFLQVNPAFSQVLGYSPEELLARPFSEFVHPEDREATVRARGVLAANQPIYDFENRYVCKDGTLRWFAWRAITDPATGRIYAVARDTTERRQAEEQLFHARRLESIGRLTGFIAHDFNNLLQVIQGHCELAADPGADAPSISKSVQRIDMAGQKAANLTRQLLAFSRQAPQKPEIRDLNTHLTDLLSMLKRVFPETISLEFAPAAQPVLARVDETQLDQLVLNLCLNARDAMGGEGVLKLELSQERRADDDFVCLSVQDSGPGISPEIQAQVFEPFFTTKSRNEGTGLGLSVVYGITVQHGGVVELESQPGETTFRVLLPAVEPGDSGSSSILVADDDLEVRDLVTTMLEGAGYRVLVAQDGQEAVELARAHPEVSLALLDVVMPRMGGADACDQLLTLNPDLGVVFMSGYSYDRLPTRLTSHMLLVKPFRRAELLETVREHLGA